MSRTAPRKPIGSDFVPEIATRRLRCSECRKVIDNGDQCLVSIKDGKVRKRVCGENCRLEFDARFWQAAARRNAAGRKR